MPLNANHLADLRSSGLDDEIIQQANIHSCNAKYASTYLQRSDLTGDLLAFPYAATKPTAKGDLYVRFKSDKELHYSDGSSGRYVQKGGSESHLYSLPQVWARVNDPTGGSLLIVEGEKKCLRAIVALFLGEASPDRQLLPIAVGGVWNWRYTKAVFNNRTKENEDRTFLISDLQSLNLAGRIVYICFDSNIAVNPNVEAAEAALASTLIKDKRVDRVCAVRLPHDGTKHGIGLDDYLLDHSVDERRELINIASSTGLIKGHIKLIRNLPNLKPTDRLDMISALVLKDQKDTGRFYTDGNRAFYFINKSRQLNELQSIHYQFHVGDGYGLYRNGQEFKSVVSKLEEEALFRGNEANIKNFAYTDDDSVYVYNNDGGIFRIGTEGIHLFPNGHGNILFQHNTHEPIAYKENCSGYLERYLLDVANFQQSEQTILSPEQQRLLFTVWLYSLFFPNLLPTKPILTMTGEFRSGKSTIQRLIGKLLFGRKFNVTMLQSERDFLAGVANEHYLVYDNVDVNEEWIRNAICSLATGFTIKLRKLYTTNEMYEADPICYLAINSMTQSLYKRPDVASRLLIFRTKALKQTKPEDFFHRDILQYRNEIFSEIFDTLQQILPHIKHEHQYTGNFRMADFANLGFMMCKAWGREYEFQTTLDILSHEQASLPTEDDPIVECLEKWLHGTDNAGKFVTAGELFGQLKGVAEAQNSTFPFKSVVSFGRNLASMVENLRHIFNIDVQKGSGNKTLYSFTNK